MKKRNLSTEKWSNNAFFHKNCLNNTKLLSNNILLQQRNIVKILALDSAGKIEIFLLESGLIRNFLIRFVINN